MKKNKNSFEIADAPAQVAKSKRENPRRTHRLDKWADDLETLLYEHFPRYEQGAIQDAASDILEFFKKKRAH